MPYAITTATAKVAALSSRLRMVQGGTSAGKSIAIAQVLIDLAQRDIVPTVTSIVSESMPHLKRGAIRDFVSIMQDHEYFDDTRWNKTDYIYTLENGSIIEFFSADQPGKVRGPRRRRLWMNECNNLPFETFEQLEVRTLEAIYGDWNPAGEFWFNDQIEGKRDDYEHIILNYLDNEALAPEIVRSIEQRKNRPDWWRVYGMGLLGEILGQIYAGWQVIDDIPQTARLERRYLDFGYTNDPSAMGDIYYWNGAYILDEILYQKGMSNKQLADVIIAQPNNKVLVVGDSAEPKSIDEIASYGVPIIPSVKGKGSVVQGIQLVQGQKIFVTKRSTNIIKEQRNYLWLVDKDGKILNVEDPACANHHMAGARYGLTSLEPVIRRQEWIDAQPKYKPKPPVNRAR